MILYPAIDIQGGKAVRLRRGRKEESTVFAENPLDCARRWRSQGADCLHIVDLDGAFAGAAKSAPIIRQICALMPAQVGGGIRDFATAAAYLESGARRVIIGTVALEDPALFARLCRAFPGRVGVSLDAEGGRLRTHGWEAATQKTVADVLPRLEEAGCAFVIYTDIERDGMRSGINLEALEQLLKIAHVPVICAGGVASLQDMTALAERFADTRLEGAISGRALYDGSLDFARASAILAGAR